MNNIQVDIGRLRQEGIYVMAPTYGGQCFTSFTRSMIELTALCARYGIPFDVYFIQNESLIQRARNYCTHMFLNATFNLQFEDGRVESKHFEHGLFIDADIGFRAEDVLVLAHLQNEAEDRDVIAATYPKKHISWEKVVEAVNKGIGEDNPEILENVIGDFVFNPVEGNSRISMSQVAEVAETGTGFMMFRRETLLKFRKAYPEQSYKPDHIRTDTFDGSQEVTAFFDCVIDPTSKRYLSEDYFFCQKVREAGMKIWLVPWINLDHNGFYTFRGNLPAVAHAGLNATVDVEQIKKKKN